MIDLTKIPKKTGCYMFKDNLDKIIYIGKAKDLSKRVKSYFKKNNLDEKTRILVSNIKDIDFFVTDNEIEALILENNLIKKNKPKYNIDLKDSKRYAYIQVTEEEFPRILIARKIDGEGKFYGPFVSAVSRDYIIEALNKVFKIRTCKKLPHKECIRYSIGLCSAPCILKISKSDYEKNIKSAELILKGKINDLIRVLFNEMKEFSRNQEYERALGIKSQIEAIKNLEERQKMERQIKYDEDLINYVLHEGKVYLMIFKSKKGIIENKIDFDFEESPNFLEEFIVQYYSEKETIIPKRIILPIKVEKILQDYLQKISKRRIKIETPIKGDKKNLLDLIKKNIEINLFENIEKVEDLAKELRLNDYPKTIECFDISHLSGTLTVASMVQFRNGKPDKSNYRRFKIKTVEGIDDFASIREVIRRRYTKLILNKESLPNLIVIDGGKGQLSSALKELEKLNIKIPIVSIAKREEEIFEPGKSEPIVLNKKGKALRFLQEIRDEAHRFAISYNKVLRKKKMFE